MKPKLTTPSGVTGTFSWLIRELAHHPSNFTDKDIEFLYTAQPHVDSRWRAVLQIREISNTPLPDQFVNNVMAGKPFVVDNTPYTFDGFVIKPVVDCLN